MLLKKYLQQFTKEALIAQIIELNSKYKDVKTYYEFSINPNGNAQATKVKKVIHKLFNPPFGQDPKLREARKEVSGFKKLSPSEDALADVMMYYVECGVQFTNNYGDINEPFYNSVAGMFHDACVFIQKNNLENVFKQRCLEMVNDTKNIGWGFHDELSDYYSTFIETE